MTGSLIGMDPDVMLTIVFVGYAVLVTAGIGVLILIADGQREPSMDDDAARSTPEPGGATRGRY